MHVNRTDICMWSVYVKRKSNPLRFKISDDAQKNVQVKHL